MILVDRREKPGKREKLDLMSAIRRWGVKVEETELPYGDIAFAGKGTDHSDIAVGIERKRIHDALTCVDDSRLAGHQMIGMRHLFDERWVLMEGYWRYHDPKGLLMESRDGVTYFECRPSGRPVLYSKLRRYLFSVQRSGFNLLFTRDLWHTAYDVVELYHYYQKRDHTAMLTPQRQNIPALTRKPPLVYSWAFDLEGIGVKMAEDAAKLFKTPEALANSSEMEWLAIPGVGVKTATSIRAQIEGKVRK